MYNIKQANTYTPRIIARICCHYRAVCDVTTVHCKRNLEKTFCLSFMEIFSRIISFYKAFI